MADGSDSKKPSAALIALLVVAASIVVFLVCGLWWFRQRHRRSKTREEEGIGHREIGTNIQPSVGQSIPLDPARRSSVGGVRPVNRTTGATTHPSSGATDLGRADRLPPSSDTSAPNADSAAPQPHFNQSTSLFRPGSQIRLMPQRKSADAGSPRLPHGSQAGRSLKENPYPNPHHNSFPIITSLQNQHLSRLLAPFEMPADIESSTLPNRTTSRKPYAQDDFSNSTSCLELDTNSPRSHNPRPPNEHNSQRGQGNPPTNERHGPRHVQSEDFSQRSRQSLSPESLSYLRPEPLHIRKTQSNQQIPSRFPPRELPAFSLTRGGSSGGHGAYDSDGESPRHRPSEINANSSFLDLRSDQDGHYESISVQARSEPVETTTKAAEISDTLRKYSLSRRDDPKDSVWYSRLPVSGHDLGERPDSGYRHSNKGKGQLPVESLIRESFRGGGEDQEGLK